MEDILGETQPKVGSPYCYRRYPPVRNAINLDPVVWTQWNAKEGDSLSPRDTGQTLKLSPIWKERCVLATNW